MFERIVVPVDGSDRSLEAVRAGVFLAGNGGTRLDIVTVVGNPAEAVVEEDEVRAQLMSLGAFAAAASPVALIGDSVPDTLQQYVAEVPGTLVVMSSTGRGRSAAVLGSVAEELLAAELGPVLLVGPHATPDRLLTGDIIVPLDGSPTSEHALGLAAAWGADRTNRTWVVTVVSTAAETRREGDVLESGYVRNRAGHLHEQLDREVEYEVLHGGSPARALVDYAATLEAGLIVMSTHGRSGLRRIVMGSVAADVVRHAPCPVLLERPMADADGSSSDATTKEVTT